MAIEITVHRAFYAPWKEHADERERIGEESEEMSFDNARKCADWLEKHGIQSPSQSGPYRSRTWLSDLDAYEDGEGMLTKQSAHAETTVDARLWAAIVHTVSQRWTRYAGPYYVERRNVDDVRV